MLPETSRAVDNQLEAAFAPVYDAIEPFVARLHGDTALDLTLPSRTESVIRTELIGGLEERLNHAQDSVGRVMQTEMHAELAERLVELEDWFDREVGWLPAGLRAGYGRFMLKPIHEEAHERLDVTVNPSALREKMRGVERSVTVGLASVVLNQLTSTASTEMPAPEVANAAPERWVPRAALRTGVASAIRFGGRWAFRFLPGTAIAANAVWVASLLREWLSREPSRSEALARDLRRLVDDEKDRSKAAMLRAVNQVRESFGPSP